MTKMTKPKAREWLKAVRKLIQHYMDGDIYFNCPLCEVVDPCRLCLWYIFSADHCISRMERYLPGYSTVCDLRRNPQWVKLSLARLKRWEKRLLAIIEGNK